jgi:UDP-N-acetylmuramate dehydrogenase
MLRIDSRRLSVYSRRVPVSIRERVPLAPLSTLGVGGPARFFACVADERALADAIDWAASRRVALFVLGGGSNLVIADEGWDGLVVQMAIRGIDVDVRPEAVDLTIGSGELWDEVVAFAVERGWAGIECLSGIPGRVGATPIQNVGAYGQDVAETILGVDAIDLQSGEAMAFDARECAFGYRESRFKGRDHGRYAIAKVRYRLRPNAPPSVRYPELARALEGIAAPTLADVRAAVVSVRRRKSMVIDAADPYSRSVGSFFVNPVVDAPLADAAEAELRRRGHLAGEGSMPRYPAPAQKVKVPAAWLIEHAGLPRGLRRGAVGLSPHHALAIVNYGEARAAEIVAFATEVRDRVRDRTGLTLTPEPVFVGISFPE